MDTQTEKPIVQFRASGITSQQLKELVKKWGVNRSQVIIRCIDRMWVQEIGSRPIPGEERKEAGKETQ